MRRAVVLGALLLTTACTPSSATSARAPAATPATARGDAGRVAAARLAPCPATAEAGDVSGRLPAVTLPCLGEGPAVRLAGLTGEPTVVNVWASWCGPCQQEAPRFQALSARGVVRVIGVVYEDDTAAALDFAAAAGLHFPSALDGDGALKRAGVTGLPVTFFLDPSGRIAGRKIGQITSDAELRGLVRRYLGVAA